MLYFYRSISPHRIENLHSYLDFFFMQLFAEVNSTYNHEHYIHPDFQNIIDTYKVQIDDKLELIFDAYIDLNPAQKESIKDAYSANTDIENICNATVTPVKYEQLPGSIRTPIKNLYDNLWGDNKVLGYVQVAASCGTVKQHFNDFRQVNENSVCPFCGINGLLCENDNGKNDYDHYLKKSDYPFISVHFSNLFPMCHDCNSKYKGQKDIPFNEAGEQREVYYPLDGNQSEHEILVSINSSTTDLKDLNQWSLDIDCRPAENVPKKDTWLEIFQIESRYKARIAKDSSFWKNELIREHHQLKGLFGDNLNYTSFKDIVKTRFDHVHMKVNGIVEKTFHEFILDDPDFENNLNGVL